MEHSLVRNIWAQHTNPRLCLDHHSYFEFAIRVSPEPIDCFVSEPVLGASIPICPSEKITKERLDEVTQALCDVVLSLEDRRDNNAIVLLRSGSRSVALNFFDFKPAHRVDLYTITSYLKMIELPNMKLHWQIEDGLGPWLVMLRPNQDQTWDEIRALIRQKRKAKPSKITYGLSHEAGAILDWLLSLSTDQFDRGLSPVVEDYLKLRIGFRPTWEKENWNLFFGLICEEILEKTPYKPRAYPWYSGSEIHTRIQFNPKSI